MVVQFSSVVGQLVLYMKFERLFQFGGRFDEQKNLKTKLRLGFIPFIFIVTVRTMYFFFMKGLFLRDREHNVIQFEKQIFVYVQEVIVSLIIISFISIQFTDTESYERSMSQVYNCCHPYCTSLSVEI